MKNKPITNNELESIVLAVQASINDWRGLLMAGHREMAINQAINDGLIIESDGLFTVKQPLTARMLRHSIVVHQPDEATLTPINLISYIKKLLSSSNYLLRQEGASLRTEFSLFGDWLPDLDFTSV